MKKNYTIYFMQTAGILLVVLGHSFYQNMYSLPVHWIYSFHMPLFFFISGYLLKYTAKKPLYTVQMGGTTGFVSKKAQRLLVPYLIISTLFFVPKVFLNHLAARPVDSSWHGYVSMLLYPYNNVIGSFWFLPTLFLILLTAMVAIKTGHRLPRCFRQQEIMWLLPALAVLHLCIPIDKSSCLNVSGVAHFMVFFAMGYYACQYGLEDRTAPYAHLLAPLTLVVSLLFLLADVDTLHSLSLLTATNGILMTLTMGQLYVKRNLRFFHHLYGATYTIYLLSFVPQFLVNQLLLHFVDLAWPVSVFLSFVSGVYLPYIVYSWISRHPHNKLSAIILFVTGQQSLAHRTSSKEG